MYSMDVRRFYSISLGLALLLGVVLLVWGSAPPGQAYSVEGVQRGRAVNPGSWVGRTVLVRGAFAPSAQDEIRAPLTWRNGVLVPPPPPLIVLRAPGVTGRAPATPRTLLLAGVQIATQAARRIPGIGSHLLTAPYTPTIVYRVRILPVHPCMGSSLGTPCPEAVLLQAVGA